MSVINVEHISKLYGDKMILEDLSCSVVKGIKLELLALMGPVSQHFFELSRARKKQMREKLFSQMV